MASASEPQQWIEGLTLQSLSPTRSIRHTLKIDDFLDTLSTGHGNDTSKIGCVGSASMDVDFPNDSKKFNLQLDVVTIAVDWFRVHITDTNQHGLLRKITCSLQLMAPDGTVFSIMDKVKSVWDKATPVEIYSPSVSSVEVAKVIPKGQLVLVCELEMAVYQTASIGNPYNSKQESFFSDFFKLLWNGKYADIIIKSKDGRKIKCHKLILVAQSEVLEKIINNYNRKAVKSVTSNDPEKVFGIECPVIPYDKETTDKLLNFLYSGYVDADEIDAKLLEAATVLKIDRLKALCIENLPELLSVENASDILAMAHRLELTEMMANTIGFIQRNMGMVLKSDGWEKEIMKNPELTNLVISHLAKK